MKLTEEGWVVQITLKDGTKWLASGKDCDVRVFPNRDRSLALEYADQLAQEDLAYIESPRMRSTFKVVRVKVSYKVQPEGVER